MTQQFYSEYFTEGNEIRISKRYLQPHIHGSITHNGQPWKRPKCPSTEERIKKIFTLEHYSTIKEKRKSCSLQQHGWTLRALC